MNIAPLIEKLKAEIKLRETQIAVINEIATRLPPDFNVMPTTCDTRIDFDYLDREHVSIVLRSLALGKWEKTPANDGNIDYVNTTAFPVPIRLYNAKPPPNCKLVEYEETIPAQPAQVVKRRKLVCLSHDEAVAAVQETSQEATPV